VRHVDRREEALDLLFRIARLCELGSYAIESSDVRNLKIRIVRQPKEDGRYLPIPALSSAVRYEDDVVSPGVAAPAINVGKFGPSLFANTVRNTLLKEWKPGKRIHFFEPAASWELHAISAGAAAVAAGFMSYHFASHLAAWLPGWGTMALSILLAPPLTCAVIWLVFRERVIVFDWPTGTVAWRFGGRWRHAQLDQIERLDLRGLKRDVKQKKSPSNTHYWCRLDMIVRGRRVFIVESNKYCNDADTPANRLGSLAAALADSVSVKWQWRDYRG